MLDFFYYQLIFFEMNPDETTNGDATMPEGEMMPEGAEGEALADKE